MLAQPKREIRGKPTTAISKIAAGASLVQLYTGFIYQGPGIARDINEGLQQILKREGFQNLDAAVGCRAEERSS